MRSCKCYFLTLPNQSPILPAGTIKMGTREYLVQTNSSPNAIQEFNMLPVKTINGATVYVKDVAHVRDGYLVQTNIVRQDGKRGALLTVLKNGTTSTLTIVGNVRKKLPFILAGLPKALQIKPIFRSNSSPSRRCIPLRQTLVKVSCRRGTGGTASSMPTISL